MIQISDATLPSSSIVGGVDNGWFLKARQLQNGPLSGLLSAKSSSNAQVAHFIQSPPPINIFQCDKLTMECMYHTTLNHDLLAVT